ncbi:MAG TPA: DUF1223 domain-containing protein [Stellaceae bacterium]|nr:DUF1223 domain-containing protein [Stellaceae bacterium]
MVPMFRFLLLAALVAVAAPARAADRPPVVVELFTSQGCNSCPRADAYLGTLTQRPGLLPLAFHVAYWNYIGWADPFSRPWAAARQRSYQKSLNERFVYTPQIVVNGAMQGVGSEPAKIDALIKATEAAPPPPHPTLTVRRREDGALLVEIGAGASPPRAPADVWLIGYDRMHRTKVLRGENEGQTLTDYNVVRSYRRIGAWPGWSLELVVPAAEIPARKDGGVAVLLQSEDMGPILTAARLDNDK